MSQEGGQQLPSHQQEPASKVGVERTPRLIGLVSIGVASAVCIAEFFVLDGVMLAIALSVVATVIAVYLRAGPRLVIVWPLMLLILFGMHALKTKWMVSQANQIADACEKYKAERSRYPTTLEELVPTYLRSVPPGNAINGPWKYSPPVGTQLRPTLCLQCLSFHPQMFDFRSRKLLTMSR